MSQASDRGKPDRKSDVAPVSGTVVTPTTPSGIEKAIDERRAHLAATVDELVYRAKPKEIARRASVGVQARVREITHTPDGQLRTERLAAVGGAVSVVLGLMVYLRRRRAKK